MKKMIQKITKLVALSVWLVGYYPALATAPQGGCFDTNEECPWHVGVKAWYKFPISFGSKCITLGYSEHVIGPFVEWKPLNGIGIQAGVAYNHNKEMRIKADSLINLINLINGSAKVIDANSVKFRGISIPVSIRWYPGNDRQFALHIGPRFMIPLGKAKQVSLSKAKQVSLGKAKQVSDKIITEYKLRLFDNVNYENGNDLEIPSYLVFDFGFAYNTKCGFIIGMQGLGLALGYDFTKLLIKA